MQQRLYFDLKFFRKLIDSCLYFVFIILHLRLDFLIVH